MSKCPFNDPKFVISVDAPCPVCGELGGFNEEDRCVDNAKGSNTPAPCTQDHASAVAEASSRYPNPDGSDYCEDDFQESLRVSMKQNAFVEGAKWGARSAATIEQQGISAAPKDDHTHLFEFAFKARAYWDAELKRWVLTYPLKADYVPNHAKYIGPADPRNDGGTDVRA